MTPGAKRLLHVANLTVGGTGLVYAWMLYLAEPAEPDPFAIAALHHPWQPAVKNLHVLFAPLLVFAIGLIWSDHVWKRVRSGFPLRRRVGLTLAALAAPMIASGYLLQTSVDETWHDVWVWTHVGSSTLWIAAYLAHLAGRRRAA